MIGLENIALVHLNDCKVEYNSKVDRHENLGQGYIGLTGLKSFIKNCYKYNIPLILETPSNEKNEIQMIKKIIQN